MLIRNIFPRAALRNIFNHIQSPVSYTHLDVYKRQAAEHALPQSVCRMGFIRHFIGLFRSADKGFDFLNALGIGLSLIHI